MSLATFAIPHGLARRLAMPAGLAYARRDAALVARIERAYCRSHGIDGWERNARARGAARRFVRSWTFQHGEAPSCPAS